ncbi:hypothetical protein HKX48_007092 [Thoreauomyces humboldtii]|nr:hypothetical protein HKX48_007092 [Thoreauomyces humboldtii]
MLRRAGSFTNNTSLGPSSSPTLSEDAVTIGRAHVPLLGREIASPVANVDTVPYMNVPPSLFETRFHAKEDAFKVAVFLFFAVLAWCAFRILTNDKVNERVFETKVTLDEALRSSDVVITGVPSPSYKIDTAKLKDGVVAVNFSTAKNFNDDIKSKASIYVPSVGKVTVAMLERNLLRLYDYQTRK